MPLSIVWLIAVIVFVLVEASTMGLTSVWFACGALIAMIAALLGANTSTVQTWLMRARGQLKTKLKEAEA